MEYTKVTVWVTSAEMSGLVVALLSDLGYQGFEEDDKEIYAYISRTDFDHEQLTAVLEPLKLAYSIEIIPEQNWNAIWESNFEPILLPGFCRIRADFHEPDAEIPLELVIIPKMSFGTGHHATTQLMMLAMKDLEFNGKAVLDFGTGTGVLAILAQKLGAGTITAIDNDPWSIANALENVERNHSHPIDVREGTMEMPGTPSYDVILANINRHILLQYMPEMSASIRDGGDLLLSGILAEDRDIITSKAQAYKLSEVSSMEKDSWLALHFRKI